MEIFYSLDYADSNTLYVIRYTVNLILSVLKNDIENAMSWFNERFMQVNSIKLQFILMKKYESNKVIFDSIEIHGNINRSEID